MIRYILLIFFSCFLASALYGQSCTVCGDADGSGTVDIADALVISQYVSGLRPAVPCPIMADVNNNGVVDIVDALYINQYTVGLRTLTCLDITIACCNCGLDTPCLSPVNGVCSEGCILQIGSVCGVRPIGGITNEACCKIYY